MVPACAARRAGVAWARRSRGRTPMTTRPKTPTSPPPPPEVPAPTTDLRVRVRGDLPLQRIFTPKEADLVQAILAAIQQGASEGRAPVVQLRDNVEHGLQSLATLALALESYPSLKDRQTLAARERSFETLLTT